MQPHLSENDKQMFYKYLNISKNYFEYGSGGSTYQASIRDNILMIYSVESDIEWQNKLKKNIVKDNVKFLFKEMNTLPNTWGSPGKNCTVEQKKHYSNGIRELSKNEQKGIDLILIDGRFRVACCLKCFDIIENNCFIAFDDFLNRQFYHIVLKYFDIIEKTQDNTMVILKKRDNVSVPHELIEEYELDQR